MADDDKKMMNVDTQIFHELGKLGADQQSIIREMTGIRTDVKERTDSVVKKIDAHLSDDTTRFDRTDAKIEKHGERIKTLENWKLITLWYVLGVVGAIGAAGWFFGVIK